MEDEEEVAGVLSPVAASLESRSKRKKVPSSSGIRGGRGRGQGSAAAKSTTPSASIDVDTNTVYTMHPSKSKCLFILFFS
jgi:hypothetical protein